MAKETDTVAVRLSPEEHAVLIAIAQEEDLSKSQILRKALRNFVKEYNKAKASQSDTD